MRVGEGRIDNAPKHAHSGPRHHWTLRARGIGLGLVLSILIVTVYVSLLGCPAGAVKVEGDLFASGRCLTVVDGQVLSEAPGL